MKDKSKRLPVADQIRNGLEESIRHAKGEITLKTTTLEMPDRPPEVDANEPTKLRLENGMSQAVFAHVPQHLDQDGSEVGTGATQAVAGGRAIDPGVSFKSVRSARARGDVCSEPRITPIARIGHGGGNSRSATENKGVA